MTHSDETPQESPTGRRAGAGTALVAGSLVGLVLGFGGIAAAQDATPTPSATDSATTAPDASTPPDTTTEGSPAPSRDELCDELGGGTGTGSSQSSDAV